MYWPKFELKRCMPFDMGLTFTLNGNNNLVIRNISDDDNEVINITYSYTLVRKLVEYLVDSGAGTNKGIGKVGDITKTGTSKLSYVMVTKDKDHPTPKHNEDYAGIRLTKPNQFVLYTLGSDIKIDATIETGEYNGELCLRLKGWNIPKEGVTLPTTITDGFTNWLSYWFATEAVARRMGEPRNKVTKFKGHHSMSDIYVTNDDMGNKILVAIFNDKNPTKCLVFQDCVGNDGLGIIRMFEYDILTEDMKLVTEFWNSLTAYNIIDYINFNLTGFSIKARADENAFGEYYNRWRFSLTKRIATKGGFIDG